MSNFMRRIAKKMRVRTGYDAPDLRSIPPEWRPVARFVRAVSAIAQRGCDYEGEDVCGSNFPRSAWCGPCLVLEALRELEAPR